jgi:hypothetical protein
VRAQAHIRLRLTIRSPSAPPSLSLRMIEPSDSLAADPSQRAWSIMTRRSQSLTEALADLDAGTLANVARIVVSEDWWEALSDGERSTYTRRCADRGITLSTDDRISRHFVELVGRNDPPLSSERRV